jgi:hypothetical protein
LRNAEEPKLTVGQRHRTILFRATGYKEQLPKFVISTDRGIVPLQEIALANRPPASTPYFAVVLALPNTVTNPVSVRVGIGASDWKELGVTTAGGTGSFPEGEFALGNFYRQGSFGGGRGRGGGGFGGANVRAEPPTQLAISMAHTFIAPNVDFRLLATNKGSILPADALSDGIKKQLGGLQQVILSFGDVKQEDLGEKLILQHRKIEWATISDIAIEPRLRAAAADPAAGTAIIPADNDPAANQPGEFFILGAVARPGVYSLTDRKVTIKQALAAAGMDLEKAKDLQIKLIRRTGDRETTTTVNVAAILNGTESDRYLQPSDMIQVERADGALP